MIAIFKELGALTVILFLVSIHFFTGSIRGIIRYMTIRKFYYDYYDHHPLKFVGRIRHNLSHTMFAATTFYISASITIVIFLIFLLLNY